MAYRNPEDAKRYQARRQIVDRERIAARKKKHYEANKETVMEQHRLSYQKHRTARLERVKIYTKLNWDKIKQDKKRYVQSPRGRWKTYHKSAKGRELEFTLEEQEFYDIISKPCHYCGQPSANGIDRKDNSVGYISSNSLPCCRKCNFMKRATNYEEFIAQCKLVSQHHSQK